MPFFWRKKSHKKLFEIKLVKSGFTLLELLVAIGVFAILASIVLIAINPVEQIRKSQDLNSKTVATDFVNTTGQYFASKKFFPGKQTQLV